MLFAIVCLLSSSATSIANRRLRAKIGPSLSSLNTGKHHSEVRSMFGFAHLSLVLVVLAMLASLVPGIYARRMISLGRVGSVPDFVLTSAVVLPVIPSLVLAPVVMYADDCKLRRHLLRQIANSRLGLWVVRKVGPASSAL